MKANYTNGIKASPPGDGPRVMGTALMARLRFLWLGFPLLAAIACLACSPATAPDSAIAGAHIEVIANPGHVGGVARAAFFPGGERLITTGWNGDLRVWDASNGALIGLYRAHQHRVNAIAVSPSGTQFVSGDTAGNLMLWSFGDSHPRKLWTHSHTVRNVAFTGEYAVLSYSYDPLSFPPYGYLEGDRWMPSESLVAHDLLRSESRPVTLPSEMPQSAIQFVGSRYLLRVRREERTWRGLVLDPKTLSPIADLHEDIAYAVAGGGGNLALGSVGRRLHLNRGLRR